MFVASWLAGVPLESPHTARYAVQPQQFLGQLGIGPMSISVCTFTAACSGVDPISGDLVI